jgi:Flp pilus assembly protein TadG
MILFSVTGQGHLPTALCAVHLGLARARRLAFEQSPPLDVAGMHGSLHSQDGKMSGPIPPQLHDLISREHGQSIIEFALALPMLVLILFGAIDLARAFQTQIIVTNAAREGARYGSTHPTATIDKFQQIAGAEAAGFPVNVISLACFRLADNLQIPCDTAQNGDRLQVTAKADFQFATLYLFHLSTITITKLASMPIVSGGGGSP